MANINFNRVILGGRLARDPEIKETQSGKKVASFCLAVSRQKEGADFLNCNAWDNTAEFISSFFHKGSCILVEGAIQTRKYTDKEGKERTATEILVQKAYFVDSKDENASAPASASASAPATAPAQGDYMADRYAALGSTPTTQQTMGTASATYTMDDSEDLPF